MRDERIAQLRADTPGVLERVHLNNAGAGLMPRPVVEAIQEHINLEARIGGYEAEEGCQASIQGTYEALAELLNCDIRNIAVTENATTSFALALSAIPFQRGDVLVTTRNDYASNQIHYLALAHRFGIEVVRAPDSPEGGVDIGAMLEIVHKRRPRLVAVSHIPTNSGLVQDVQAIGHICRERDVPFLVDACQSVGQMVVHPDELGADFLSATGRKFLRGPRGIGFLYVSDRVIDAGFEPLFPDLRGADWIAENMFQPAPSARRFENWEFPYALVLGLGAAARYAADVGLEAGRSRAWSLAEHAREQLAAIEGIRVLDQGAQRSAIVTVAVQGHDSETLVQMLRTRGINTSSLTTLSALLDFEDKAVDHALRISPHYYNTEEEIEGLVAVLRDVIRT